MDIDISDQIVRGPDLIKFFVPASYQTNDFMDNNETGQKFLQSEKETTQKHISNVM